MDPDVIIKVEKVPLHLLNYWIAPKVTFIFVTIGLYNFIEFIHQHTVCTVC